ncbi:signal peptidase II [Brevibacterium sanguinis]|uniref:Lipoprotein signal peptidase n=3 Tax=Brevibacteriaceae TaxID=85019 RepID=A0A366IJ16_9MICO|nr:signal peptidase II [Brevibacterium sanguinis]RBP70700.1 signal peptidase II [Brevibacterium celere]
MRRTLFAIAAAVLVVDQLTKLLAVRFLEGREAIPVLGSLAGFDFYRNPGAALGMGAGITWVFPLIAIAVFGAILVLSRKLGSRTWAVGLGLLLGGLFGNLVDRLFRQPGFLHGAVVDFIDLSLFICNVADIAITAAAVTLVVASLRGIDLDGSRTGSSDHTSREDTHD